MTGALKGLPACVLGIALLGAGGCATTAMKGTPFFTGEYETRKGPVEDRINVWPLAYYRDPALSVIWPLFEMTDNYAALRPLFSVYDLNTSPIYSVLWPVSQFNTGTGDVRIFPFFWGDDYRVLFPLYWHRGDPFSGSPHAQGHDMLIPLWWIDRTATSDSRYFVGPLIHTKRDARERGWFVLPVAGSYTRTDGSYYRFQAWPLLHQGGFAGNRGNWHAVVPLYYAERQGLDRTFLSLPWSRSVTEGGTRDRKLLLPLFYSDRDGDSRLFITLLGGKKSDHASSTAVIVPLLALSHRGPASSSMWVLGPLAHRSASGPQTSSHVFPLFFKSSGPRWTRFYSLPWCAERYASGWSWRLAPPVYFHSEDRSSSRTLTPLWGRGWNGTDNSRWQAILPLYISSSNRLGSSVYSLPWSRHSGHDGSSWRLVPPLYYSARDAAGERTLSPLWMSSRQGRNHWQALIPFYLKSETEKRRLVTTLLGGYEKDALGQAWMVYPLLSWSRRTGQGRDLWVVAPLAHFESTPSWRRSHVLPLYYWNGETGTLASLLAARWKKERETHTLVPPALSWKTSSKDREDLWLAGGIAHASWGSRRGAHHVAPVYYANPKTGTLVSPLYATWSNATLSVRQKAIPAALSWGFTSPKRTDLWMAGGIARASWGPERGAHHVAPLYYANPKTDTVLSLPYCTWRKGMGISPLLLSGQWRTGDERDLWVLLGLGRRTWGPAGTRSSHVLPLYHYTRDDHLYTPVFGRRKGPDGFVYPLTPLVGLRQGNTGGGWLFPVYDQRTQKGKNITDTRVLWGSLHQEANYTRSVFVPLYGYTYFGAMDALSRDRSTSRKAGRDFFCVPYCVYRNLRTRVPAIPKTKTPPTILHERQNSVFPLWSFSRKSNETTGALDRDGRVALLLYDYKRTRESLAGAPGGTNDYTRARVLYRVWHYERLNGDVSVDVIPGITYDRQTDGHKKISFLWRAFRYERRPDGAKMMDLLYLPVLRVSPPGSRTSPTAGAPPPPAIAARSE